MHSHAESSKWNLFNLLSFLVTIQTKLQIKKATLTNTNTQNMTKLHILAQKMLQGVKIFLKIIPTKR